MIARRRLTAAALALSAALAAAGCMPALFGGSSGVGVVEDPTVRGFLAPLALVEEADCTLTGRGLALPMHCRVFAGPAGERVVGVYDLVADRLAVLLLLHDDGRQEILWRPTARATTTRPEVTIL